MTNDYEGKLRCEARFQELMTEAEGGWQLRTARPVNAPKPGGLRRALPLLWAVMAIVVIVLLAALSIT
jgi:hypothetical protein